MITRLISEDCLVIYTKCNEYRSPLDAVRKAMMNEGIKQWDDVEAEEFVLDGNTMIIVRPRHPLIRRQREDIPRLSRF